MITTIDLFAGCGGLAEGFLSNSNYQTIALVEWEKAQCKTLNHRLHTKYGYKSNDNSVVHFDMQRTKELIEGWNDEEYGISKGLDEIIYNQTNKIDLIVGGPPCQAYSVAGRIRDENGMRNDYRNYLFESYLEIIKHYKPKAFIFENVPGILSAKPGEEGVLIIDEIKLQFEKAGYRLIEDIKNTIVDMSEYGVPQKRKRVIILGLRKEHFGSKTELLLERFYKYSLPSQKEEIMTTRQAIEDLPKLFPLLNGKIIKQGRKKYSHSLNDNTEIYNHQPRYHSRRDIEVFRRLAKDIETGENKYQSIESRKRLYTEVTGKKSNIHKYNVIRWDEPSNTIPAHLYKDGLRHIHPDSSQARTLTVREAARLQTFPDDFEFITGTNVDYKMIGNAVPPKFSGKLANAILDILD